MYWYNIATVARQWLFAFVTFYIAPPVLKQHTIKLHWGVGAGWSMCMLYRNSTLSSNIKTKLLKESRTGCTLCTKFKRAAIQWFVLKPGKLCDYDALGNSSIMDPFLKTASIDNSRNICALPVYLTEILMHWFIQSIERCRFSLIQSSHWSWIPTDDRDKKQQVSFIT